MSVYTEGCPGDEVMVHVHLACAIKKSEPVWVGRSATRGRASWDNTILQCNQGHVAHIAEHMLWLAIDRDLLIICNYATDLTIYHIKLLQELCDSV